MNKSHRLNRILTKKFDFEGSLTKQLYKLVLVAEEGLEPRAREL